MQLVPITANVVSSNPVLDILCDKVCQWLAASRWFSPGTLVSSTNKTDRHGITEILLKVALGTKTLTLKIYWIKKYSTHLASETNNFWLIDYCLK